MIISAFSAWVFLVLPAAGHEKASWIFPGCLKALYVPIVLLFYSQSSVLSDLFRIDYNTDL